MELPGDLDEKIQNLSERGNKLMDADDWEGAAALWQEALLLVPEPKSEWAATLWLCASLGDAFYAGKDYRRAADCLYDALNAPDGQANPFAHLRLGQCLLELGDEGKGAESLLRAYMLEGVQIFEGKEEASRYLKLLAERDLL